MSVRLIVYAAIAAALVFAIAQYRLRVQQIETLRKDNAALNMEIAKLKAERDTCISDIETQNDAIEALQAAADEQQRRVAAAERAAAQAGRSAQARVNAVLAANVPPECHAAMRWLAEQGRAAAIEWSAP